MDKAELMIDPEEMRQAMQRWATGVTVVTAEFEGVKHGMTVSSFISISLSPPRLLVSIQQAARTHELVKRSGCFGVTILDESQKEISERFAGQDAGGDRFRGLEVQTLSSGAPLLASGLVRLDCRVALSHEIGEHTLFIGEVVAMQMGDKQQPLIYFDRTYRRLVA